MPEGPPDSPLPPAPPGRGAGINTPNRFDAQRIEIEPGALVDDDGNPLPVRTQFFRDDTQGILAWNDSPDIPFRVGFRTVEISRLFEPEKLWKRLSMRVSSHSWFCFMETHGNAKRRLFAGFIGSNWQQLFRPRGCRWSRQVAK